MAECRCRPLGASRTENKVAIFSNDYIMVFDSCLRHVPSLFWAILCIISMTLTTRTGWMLNSAARGRPRVFICAPLECFVYLLPFKSYFMFYRLAANSRTGPKNRFLTTFDPLPWFGSSATPRSQEALLYVRPCLLKIVQIVWPVLMKEGKV